MPMNSKLEKRSAPAKNSLLKSYLVLAIVIFFSVFLLEFGSWAVIEVYNKSFSFSSKYEAATAEERSKTDDLFLTDPNIRFLYISHLS